MFVECRHVQPSGEKCKSPAVRNSSFCYFHRNLHDRAEARPPRQGTPFLLPVLEDSCSILIAINEVFRAMGESRIKRSEDDYEEPTGEEQFPHQKTSAQPAP
jgi:hypothetical protein